MLTQINEAKACMDVIKKAGFENTGGEVYMTNDYTVRFLYYRETESPWILYRNKSKQIQEIARGRTSAALKKALKSHPTIATTATPVAVSPMRKMYVSKFVVKHQGKRRTVTIKHLKNGVVPWQPVKIGTRFYFLRGSCTTGAGHRTERACQDAVSSAVAIYVRNMY